MRVFLIESSSPLEVMEDISEGESLRHICKMMGHDVMSFFAKSRHEFEEISNYIASIDKVYRDTDGDKPICIHLSNHGDENGLQMGSDPMTWEDISESLLPIFQMEYDEEFYLIISACGTNKQKIQTKLAALARLYKFKPPKFIFVINEETVDWRDAVLIWTIIYHQIESIDIGDKRDLQILFNKIQESEFGNLRYFRWEEKDKSYKRYPRKK